MATPALNPLVTKIRAKYPGVYDDLNDAQLTNAMLAKYPEYSDLAAPPIAKPTVSMQPVPENFAERVIGNEADAYYHAAPLVKEGVKTLANDVYDVSTPNIATQIYRKLKGLPNSLDKLPEKMVMGWLTAGGLPEGEVAPKGEALAERLQNLPEASTSLERLRNQGLPAEQPSFTPTRPSIERIQPEAAASTAPVAPVKVTPKLVESQLNDALGGKPLVSGVPLRAQPAAQVAAAAKLPEGFVPTSESSALKGYKYSPDAREFEYVTKDGSHYVRGDVAPEAFAKFEQTADETGSFGKAWHELRQNPEGGVGVAKIINGKRVPTIKTAPTTDLAQQIKDSAEPSQAPVMRTLGDLAKEIKTASKGAGKKAVSTAEPISTGDLQDALKQMLRQVKAGKKLSDLQ